MLPTVATAFGAFPLFNWNGGALDSLRVPPTP
jgi:hypothetical protein